MSRVGVPECVEIFEKSQAAKRRTHWQLIVITPWRQVISSKLPWDSCNDTLFRNTTVDVAWFQTHVQNAKLPKLCCSWTLSVEWSTESHRFSQAWNSGTFLPEWRPEISAQRNRLLNWQVAVFLRCTFIKNQARQQKRAPMTKHSGDMHLISNVLQVLLQSPVKGECFIERNSYDKRFMSGYKWNRDNLSSYQESSHFFL